MEQQRPTEISSDYDEIDLRNLFKTLGKWKIAIVSVTVIFMLVSGIFSFCVITPVYEAKAVVALVTSNQIGLPGNMTYVVNNQNGGDFTDRQKLLDNMDNLAKLNQIDNTLYKDIIISDYVLKKTVKELHLNLPIKTLKSNITAEPQKNSAMADTNIIEITVIDRNPKIAAQIANTVAMEASAYISDFNDNQMKKLDKTLEDQLTEAQDGLLQAKDKLQQYEDKTGVNEARQAAVKSQLEVSKIEDEVKRYQYVVDSYNSKIMELKVQQALYKSGDQMLLLSAATVPADPVKPNKGINIGIACILGLFVGIPGVLLVEYIKKDHEKNLNSVA